MKVKFNVTIVFFMSLIFFTGSNSFAKVSANLPAANTKSSALNENALIEELTGKKNVQKSPTAKNLKNAPLPVQHFLAGRQAAEQKNYILAIKHFNTVLKKYPQSAQVRPTLLAKAKVYQEMGLVDQASHNLQAARRMDLAMAKIITKKKSTNNEASAKTIEKVKTIK